VSLKRDGSHHPKSSQARSYYEFLLNLPLSFEQLIIRNDIVEKLLGSFEYSSQWNVEACCRELKRHLKALAV
jgi:hypothetical protein